MYFLVDHLVLVTGHIMHQGRIENILDVEISKC